MGVDNLVYSTELADKGLQVPIIFSKRADAPVRGSVFTAKAIFERDKDDLIIDRIKNYTGYIKKNLETPIEIEEGKYYRFSIVAGPYTRDYHNFFYAIP